MALSLCIVGCGGYARQVMECVYDMTDEITFYYASRDGTRAREFLDDFGGAGYFGSYEEAASDPRVEAMYFVTPHDLHLEGTRLAADNSKHVLMEKPIARTVSEAKELIGAAEEAGITLMIAENYRFVRPITRCKELIEEGLIGDIRLIQIQREMYTRIGGWRRDLEVAGGGVMIDGGIHDFDAMLNIGGFPERVYAVIPPKVIDDLEGEDGMVVTFHLPGGAVGLLHYSRGTTMIGERDFLHVTGTKGEIRFKPFGSQVVLETLNDRQTIPLGEARMGVREMLSEFHAAIRESREPAMSGREGLKDLAVVLAAYESARTGLSVSIDQP